MEGRMDRNQPTTQVRATGPSRILLWSQSKEDAAWAKWSIEAR